MRDTLAVGIRADSNYSAQVLNQLGVSSLPVEDIKQGIERGVSVFFCKESNGNQYESVEKRRIAVITHHGSRDLDQRQNDDIKDSSYYFCLPEGSPFAKCSFYANLSVFPQGEKCFGTCYDKDNNEIPNSGINIIENGYLLVVSLPWDIFSYEQGIKWEHRPYYSPTAKKHFVEIGPLFNSGAFRRLLLEMLLYCFNWVGLPLVRVSPFYKNKKYFSFRIDADGFTESSTEAGLRIAEKTGLRFTWFLDMSHWKNQQHWIKRLATHNQDIQFHCFRHMTYSCQQINNINIKKGLKKLKQNGIIANATVSPYGYNYQGFSEAIKTNEFIYSSEFGYAADDLPSYPQNDKMYPLQIPVHPGCSGVFEQSGFTDEQQFAHLREHVQRECNDDGICILYDHPNKGMDAHESQYIALFNHLKKDSYEYMCMSEYCLIWLGRPQNLTILNYAGQIHVDGFDDSGFRLEQVTNGSVDAVNWNGVELPQAAMPSRVDEFHYPSNCVHDIANRNSLLNLKQRNFSIYTWYLHEMYNALGTKIGYFRFRRFLKQLKGLICIKS